MFDIAEIIESDIRIRGKTLLAAELFLAAVVFAVFAAVALTLSDGDLFRRIQGILAAGIALNTGTLGLLVIRRGQIEASGLPEAGAAKWRRRLGLTMLMAIPTAMPVGAIGQRVPLRRAAAQAIPGSD